MYLVNDLRSMSLRQESISEMEYLEAFINENLRLHPPIVNQVRTCTKDCEVKFSIAFEINYMTFVIR